MGSAKLVLVAGACVSVSALAGPTLTTAAVDKVEDVFVKNTAEQPIPIEAEQPIPIQAVQPIAIEAVRPMPIEVQGTPTVAQAGTPVHFRGQLQLEEESSGSTNRYVVPAGKRLRIEHVTFHDGARNGQVIGLRLLSTLDGERLPHPIVTHRQGPKGEVASQAILAYADPGSLVYFDVYFDRLVGSAAHPSVLYATFMGVLLDA